MPFFVNGDAAVRVSILYILNSAGTEMTEDQLYGCAFTCGAADWFDFSQSLGVLQEKGYILEVPRPFGQALKLSGEACESEEMFRDTLPLALRMKIDAYLKEHEGDFHRAQQYTVQETPLPGGGAYLKMAVHEAGRPLLEIGLSLASEEEALCMKSRWQEESSAIYEEIWNRLMKTNGEKE